MAISVEMAKPEQTMDERQRLIDAAREMVVSDPEIMSGTPVIRGTRVPVYYLAGFVEAGDSMDEILDSYPSVTREEVELAVVFAAAFPAEEKPYEPPQLPPGATLIYSKTFPVSKDA